MFYLTCCRVSRKDLNKSCTTGNTMKTIVWLVNIWLKVGICMAKFISSRNTVETPPLSDPYTIDNPTLQQN